MGIGNTVKGQRTMRRSSMVLTIWYRVLLDTAMKEPQPSELSCSAPVVQACGTLVRSAATSTASSQQPAARPRACGNKRI